MSLLADLLSRVKHQQTKMDVPPNLRNIVVRQSAHKRKILLLSVFFAVAVISGISIIYFTPHIKSVSGKKEPAAYKPTETTATPEKGMQPEARSEQDNRLQPPQATDNRLSETTEKVKERKTAESKTSKGFKAVKTKEAKKVRDSKTAKREKFASVSDISPEPAPPAVPQPPTAPLDVRTSSQRDAYLYIAKDYEIRKEYSTAMAYYKRILEIDKNNFNVMNNIAYILLHLGLFDESLRYSLMALDIKKDHVPALINIGIAYARADNTSTAETYMKRAVTIEPDNQSVILNLAVLYEKQKDYPKAFEYFSKLSRFGNIAGLLGVARIYEKQDKAEEALNVYRNISSFNSIDAGTKKIVEQRINLLSGQLKNTQ